MGVEVLTPEKNRNAAKKLSDSDLDKQTRKVGADVARFGLDNSAINPLRDEFNDRQKKLAETREKFLQSSRTQTLFAGAGAKKRSMAQATLFGE